MSDWKFTTFDGRVIDAQSVDHQHLSNIYWFMKIIHSKKEGELWDIIYILKNRFSGIILPYRPEFEFTDEISFLDKNDMIVWIRGFDGILNKELGNIVYKGRVIGQVKSKRQIRQEKLENVGIS